MVVGCVIDPDMSDEIRVTVVATGLGRPAAAVQQPQQDCASMTAIAGGRSAPRPTLDDARADYIRNQRDPQRLQRSGRWATA